MNTVEPADHQRILIIGNSGSGKSWLASRLAAHIRADHVELDALHWEPGGFNQRRAPEAAISAVRVAAACDAWVIEGVFGWLAEEAAPRATLLLWITLPEDQCIVNLQGRSIKSGEDDASRDALLDWCRGYRSRTTSSSYAGHEAIYNRFGGRKQMLETRRDVDRFRAAFES